MNKRASSIVAALLVLSGTVFASAPQVTVDFLDSSTVNDTVIRLRDIAVVRSQAVVEQLASVQNTVIGEAAPAGYFRLVNTDDVYGYVLKAKFPRISFEKTPKKALKVATACQEKKVGEYEGLIMKYLADSIAWQPGDYTAVVKNGSESWKLLNKPFTVAITGLCTGFPRGNTNIRLIIRQGAKTYSVPVVCNITVVTPVAVAKTSISRGTLLSPQNCIIERKDITRFGYEPVTDLSVLTDLVLIRTIPDGTIIHEKMTKHVPVVEKEELVYIVVKKGQFKVTVAMRAREAGAVGDMIWVENEMSHKLMKARVAGKGKIILLEGEKNI